MLQLVPAAVESLQHENRIKNQRLLALLSVGGVLVDCRPAIDFAGIAICISPITRAWKSRV